MTTHEQYSKTPLFQWARQIDMQKRYIFEGSERM